MLCASVRSCPSYTYRKRPKVNLCESLFNNLPQNQQITIYMHDNRNISIPSHNILSYNQMCVFSHSCIVLPILSLYTTVFILYKSLLQLLPKLLSIKDHDQNAYACTYDFSPSSSSICPILKHVDLNINIYLPFLYIEEVYLQ